MAKCTVIFTFSISLNIGNFYFSFTDISLSMVPTLGLVVLVFFCCYWKGRWEVSAKCIAILGRANLWFHTEPGKRINTWSFWKCGKKFFFPLHHSYFYFFRYFHNPKCIWYPLASRRQVIFSWLWLFHFPFLLAARDILFFWKKCTVKSRVNKMRTNSFGVTHCWSSQFRIPSTNTVLKRFFKIMHCLVLHLIWDSPNIVQFITHGQVALEIIFRQCVAGRMFSEANTWLSFFSFVKKN
jgi:hypothetical protein